MFFTTGENLPEGMGFQAYGPVHLLWLAAGLILFVGGCLWFRKETVQRQERTLKRLAGCVLLLEVVKDLVLILTGEFGWGNLPLHLCGINILLIAFDAFRQVRTVRSFLYFFAIPGAALALLFPNWTDTPLCNFFHIHSFVIHILLVLYPLLLVTTGRVATDLRSALRGVGLLVGMAIPVYFLNLLWDTNFMFLMDSDTGNPLEFFKNLLGSHLWGFPILLPFVILIMYLPVRFFGKAKKVHN